LWTGHPAAIARPVGALGRLCRCGDGRYMVSRRPSCRQRRRNGRAHVDCHRLDARPHGTVGLAFATPWGPVASFVTAASVMGLGFGLSSSLMNRRLIGTLAQDDKATGSSALISVRQT